MIASLILLALALRALIPIGFEPAADGSFSLVICAEDFPTYLPAHGQVAPHGLHVPRRPGVSHDHCLFCNSSSSAPAPILAGAASVASVEIDTAVPAVPYSQIFHVIHVPQARAPPAFA